ncbi:MAG: hypothetical protein ACTS22_02210 [Phycisphaerales bacterium]
MWSIDEIADAAAAGLAAADSALRAEHAVRGVDALDETDLHPLLAAGFEAAGLGVLREWPLPETTKRRPKSSDRERCDLVLLPEPGDRLVDPVRKGMELDDAADTLFAGAADRLFVDAGIEPADAVWLEVKATGQHTTRDGVPGPNTRYTTELVRLPAADIRKLARQRAVAHAGVVVVLFAADEPTARHDLHAALHRWLDDDLPVRTPAIRVTPILDRIGNAVALVAVVPVRTAFEL